jgi:hypothetical protein
MGQATLNDPSPAQAIAPAAMLRLACNLCLAQWGPLLALLIVGTTLSMTIEEMMRGLSSAAESERLMLQVGLGLWDMIEGLVVLFALAKAIALTQNLQEPIFVRKPFAEPFLKSFFAEYLRLTAQVLLWALMLILPALYRYGQLIFIPFITLFDREYRDGKVDAIERALSLSKGRLGVILTLVLVSGAVQFTLELLPQQFATFRSLPLRLALNGLSMYLSVLAFSILWTLFSNRLRERALCT